MKMSRFEKRFVNRQRKAKGNIEKLEKQMQILELPAKLAILEIGCGIGAVSAHLAEKYSAHVRGTDFDAEEIELARRFFPETNYLKFQVEDASNLSFKNATFDMVVSQNVFHHIPQWEKAISEICRVLKEKGLLFWADLAFPRILVRLLKNRVKNYGLYSIQDVTKRFTETGFVTVQYQKKLHGPMALHQLILKKSK